MAELLKSRRVVLKEYVEGYPTEEHMELLPAADVDEAAAAEEGSVLVKNLYLSCDPYMRPKMSRPVGQSSYTSAFVPGAAITGYGAAWPGSVKAGRSSRRSWIDSCRNVRLAAARRGGEDFARARRRWVVVRFRGGEEGASPSPPRAANRCPGCVFV